MGHIAMPSHWWGGMGHIVGTVLAVAVVWFPRSFFSVFWAHLLFTRAHSVVQGLHVRIVLCRVSTCA